MMPGRQHREGRPPRGGGCRSQTPSAQVEASEAGGGARCRLQGKLRRPGPWGAPPRPAGPLRSDIYLTGGGALHTVSPLETKLEHVFPKTGWDFYIPLCPSPTHLCPTFPM